MARTKTTARSKKSVEDEEIAKGLKVTKALYNKAAEADSFLHVADDRRSPKLAPLSGAKSRWTRTKNNKGERLEREVIDAHRAIKFHPLYRLAGIQEDLDAAEEALSNSLANTIRENEIAKLQEIAQEAANRLRADKDREAAKAIERQLRDATEEFWAGLYFDVDMDQASTDAYEIFRVELYKQYMQERTATRKTAKQEMIENFNYDDIRDISKALKAGSWRIMSKEGKKKTREPSKKRSHKSVADRAKALLSENKKAADEDRKYIFVTAATRDDGTHAKSKAKAKGNFGEMLDKYPVITDGAYDQYRKVLRLVGASREEADELAAKAKRWVEKQHTAKGGKKSTTTSGKKGAKRTGNITSYREESVNEEEDEEDNKEKSVEDDALVSGSEDEDEEKTSVTSPKSNKRPSLKAASASSSKKTSPKK